MKNWLDLLANEILELEFLIQEGQFTFYIFNEQIPF